MIHTKEYIEEYMERAKPRTHEVNMKAIDDLVSKSIGTTDDILSRMNICIKELKEKGMIIQDNTGWKIDKFINNGDCITLKKSRIQ